MSAPTPLLTAKRAVSSACKKRPMPTCALSLACRRRLACNVPRQVGATYKGLWTKAKKNAEARRLGYTKRRFKGLDKAPHYVSPTLTYNLGRDYSLRTGKAGESADAGGAHPYPLPRLDAPCGAAPGGDQTGWSQTLV